MARRIAVAVLALITALLAVVAIPLGLLTSAQDRRDFQASTATAATTIANVAEERLEAGVHGTALSRSIREMGRQGDELAVYDSAGHLIASTARAGREPVCEVSGALPDHLPVREPPGSAGPGGAGPGIRLSGHGGAVPVHDEP